MIMGMGMIVAILHYGNGLGCPMGGLGVDFIQVLVTKFARGSHENYLFNFLPCLLCFFIFGIKYVLVFLS